MNERAPAMAIITIIAVIAIVGLVLVFSGAKTGTYVGGGDKLYGGGAYIPGGEGTYDRYVKAGADIPTETGPRIGGIRRYNDPYYAKSPATANQRIAPFKTASQSTNPCEPGFIARSPRYNDYTVVDLYGTEWPCTYVSSLTVD